MRSAREQLRSPLQYGRLCDDFSLAVSGMVHDLSELMLREAVQSRKYRTRGLPTVTSILDKYPEFLTDENSPINQFTTGVDFSGYMSLRRDVFRYGGSSIQREVAMRALRIVSDAQGLDGSYTG